MSETPNLYGPGSPYIHPRKILDHMPAVTVTPQVCNALRNGRNVNLPEFSDAPLVRVFYSQVGLLGVARRIAGTLFHPEVILYGSNEPLP